MASGTWSLRKGLSKAETSYNRWQKADRAQPEQEVCYNQWVNRGPEKAKMSSNTTQSGDSGGKPRLPLKTFLWSLLEALCCIRKGPVHSQKRMGLRILGSLNARRNELRALQVPQERILNNLSSPFPNPCSPSLIHSLGGRAFQVPFVCSHNQTKQKLIPVL